MEDFMRGHCSDKFGNNSLQNMSWRISKWSTGNITESGNKWNSEKSWYTAINKDNQIQVHVRWGPCPQSMAHPRVADGGTASRYGG
jgi:hypothetical protein